MFPDADDLTIAAHALKDHDVAPDSELTLLNVSENATFALTDAGTGERSIVRVHRHGYHQPHQIESELDWLESLRTDSDVAVPGVIAARDGRRVVDVDVNGTPRQVVPFRDGRGRASGGDSVD